MPISRLIAYAQQRFAKHREYRRLIAEIDSLSQKDLIEIGAFQSDLYKAAHREVFGA